MKDKKLEGNIIFKRLSNEAKTLKSTYITGVFKVTGNSEIPPAFIKFESQTDFENKINIFKVKVLSKIALDIFIDNKTVYFINHINKRYLKLEIEKIDTSLITGVNFDPGALSYIFSGSIPYSENMDLINLKTVKNSYQMLISDNENKYELTLNKKLQILTVKITSQLYDSISLDGIRYGTYEDNAILPKQLNFSHEASNIKISFILNNIKKNYKNEELFNKTFLSTYKEVSSIEDLDIKKR